MSICQRKTGAWLVKYKDAASNTWKQRQFKSRQEAEAFDSSASIARQKDEPLSLMEAVGAYLQRRTMSQGRISTYLYMVKPGHGPAGHLANRYVSSLNRTDLESVRSSLRARGLRTATINKLVGMIKAVLRWCASEDLIPDDPWAKYRALPGARYEHRTGTVEDLRRVYQFLPLWLQWAVRTAVALCLRPGRQELFGLTWDRFDWKAGTVSVYMSKTDATKVVFAPAWYLAEARERWLADREAGQIYVCRGARNRRLSARSPYTRAWNGACRQAGVRMKFYALRHIAASEMLAAGADLAAIAAQLGHKNITTTAAFYTHAVARAQRQAAEALPATTLGEQW